MNASWLRAVVIVGLMCLGPGAGAQVSVYVTASPIHVSGVETGVSYPPQGPGPQYQTTSFWATGIGGGATLNFLKLGPVSLGLDLRGSTRPGTVGADTVMAGFKLGGHAPLVPLKPYVQVSAGYLGTRTFNTGTGGAGQTFENKYVAYEVLGGLDFAVFPFVDLRLAEVGVGKAYNTGTSFSGTQYNPTIVTVNSGIVVHF